MIRKSVLTLLGLSLFSAIGKAREIPTESTTDVTGLITREGSNILLSNDSDTVINNGKEYPLKKVWVWPEYTDGVKVRRAVGTNKPITLHGRFEWKEAPLNHMVFVEEG